MNRKELYEIINSNDLGEAIKNYFGSDYTHVTNAGLEEFLRRNDYIEEENEDECEEEFLDEPTELEEKVDRLIYILVKKHLIMDSELDYIMGR